jgi:hypothetical protein
MSFFNPTLFDQLCREVSKDVKEKGTILHRLDDKFILETTPEMIGTGSPALQEIHIFLGPIWVGDTFDSKIIERYTQIVGLFNEIMKDSYENFKPMKAPVLALKFAEIGYVTVMQSSLYVLSNDRQKIIDATHQISDMFILAGFTVLREKIEASIYGIDGIPQTRENAEKYNKYFEFHIRVSRTNTEILEPLKEEELNKLEIISETFRKSFGVPIPLSFNRAKEGTREGLQRYLNLRTRGIGAIESKKKVDEIVEAINKTGDFRVEKVIAEYPWGDSNVELDKGWIDF